MEPPLKKSKRTSDFSIRSLIDCTQNKIQYSSSHITSPSKSTSNESLQYSPSSSSTCTAGGNSIIARLSWSQNTQSHWLPDAEIIDKARKNIIYRLLENALVLLYYLDPYRGFS
jgi:hypothetical protein